jgi:hypothetical protein
VKLGFAPEIISSVLEADGMTKEAAEGMTKEAIYAQIGRGIASLGSKLLGGAAKLAPMSATRAAPAATSLLGKGVTTARGVGSAAAQRAGQGLQAAGRAFAANPAKALWGGAKNFGSGAMMMQGKGLGGALGKGAFGASMYGMMSGPGEAQLPQAYGGSVMRQPYSQ